MEARVGAIGHSHVALWFRRAGEGEVEVGARRRPVSSTT